MNSKVFDLRTILTATTGMLLTKSKSKTDNGISRLYELLDYITDNSTYTHQLGRVSEECKPHIFKTHSHLNGPRLREEVKNLKLTLKTEVGRKTPEVLINDWIFNLVAKNICVAEYEISKMNSSEYTPECPIRELDKMLTH